MKLICDIVEDLLPLYVDGVCSEQSKQAVAEHLRGCEKCRKIAEGTQAVPLPHIEPEQPAADRAVKKGFRKIRFRWFATLLTIIALIPVAFLGWNEYSAQGIAYSNSDELVRGNTFMSYLVAGNYAKAYSYLDIEEIKQEWLEVWFDAEKLANMEADGLAKFCELGKKLDALGGIESYEYIGISLGGEDSDGTKVYRITYRIRFQGKGIIAHVDVSDDGVERFSAGESFIDDPLAQFSIWSEYLWQDYAGCYFDPNSKDYVYYDKSDNP